MTTKIKYLNVSYKVESYGRFWNIIKVLNPIYSKLKRKNNELSRLYMCTQLNDTKVIVFILYCACEDNQKKACHGFRKETMHTCTLLMFWS